MTKFREVYTINGRALSDRHGVSRDICGFPFLEIEKRDCFSLSLKKIRTLSLFLMKAGKLTEEVWPKDKIIVSGDLTPAFVASYRDIISKIPLEEKTLIPAYVQEALNCFHVPLKIKQGEKDEALLIMTTRFLFQDKWEFLTYFDACPEDLQLRICVDMPDLTDRYLNNQALKNRYPTQYKEAKVDHLVETAKEIIKEEEEKLKEKKAKEEAIRKEKEDKEYRVNVLIQSYVDSLKDDLKDTMGITADVLIRVNPYTIVKNYSNDEYERGDI